MDTRANDPEQRSITAIQLIEELIKNTRIPSTRLDDTTSKACRDRCLDALTQARASTHYKEISDMLAHGQTLLDDELFYYVVSVDDVNKLDEKVFEQLKSIEKEYKFSHWWQGTLSVLLRAHEWQIEQDPAKKGQLNEALYTALRGRGSCKNHTIGYYLNMRGFNFEGADLTSTSLDFMDLENANFSRAILHNATIKLSDISHAQFYRATAIRGRNQKNFDQEVFALYGTIAKNASFDEVDFSEPFFTECDFSGSTFKYARIASATLDKAILDDSDFSHCTLSMTCDYTVNRFSMKNTNLVDAELHPFTLRDAEMTGVKCLSNDAFMNVDNLNAELDKALQLLKKFTESGSDVYKQSQNELFKKMIADNVVAGCSGLSNDNVLKQQLIDAALSHSMLLPETEIKRFFFSVSRSMYAAQCTLFGKDNQQHIYRPSSALQVLEEASEEIIPTMQYL